MSAVFNTAEVSVLLVSVSVVALPTKVSVASGNVKVLSAVGFPAVSVNSLASSLDPSNTKSVVIVAFIAIVSDAAFPIVVFPVVTKSAALI